MEKQDKKWHKTGENKALNELKAMLKIDEYNVDFYNTLKYRRLQNMANFRDLSHQNRRKTKRSDSQEAQEWQNESILIKNKTLCHKGRVQIN